MAAAAGAAVAAATAEPDDGPLLPGPPVGRRAVCSRPYFVVLMVFAHLYVINVLGLLLFVHISSDDGGEPEPTKETPGPVQEAPLLPVSSGNLDPQALPRLQGIKASAFPRATEWGGEGGRKSGLLFSGTPFFFILF